MRQEFRILQFYDRWKKLTLLFLCVFVLKAFNRLTCSNVWRLTGIRTSTENGELISGPTTLILSPLYCSAKLFYSVNPLDHYVKDYLDGYNSTLL